MTKVTNLTAGVWFGRNFYGILVKFLRSGYIYPHIPNRNSDKFCTIMKKMDVWKWISLCLYLTKWWSCKEKMDACHCWGFKGLSDVFPGVTIAFPLDPGYHLYRGSSCDLTMVCLNSIWLQPRRQTCTVWWDNASAISNRINWTKLGT